MYPARRVRCDDQPSVNDQLNDQLAKTRIAVVDHGTGNLTSLSRALVLAGADVVRAESPEGLKDVDGVVLPGVGAFPAAIESFRKSGFEEPIRDVVDRGIPVLGVCLGMQMLFEGSDEHGGAEGLGLIEGRVVLLDSQGERMPHIGWSPVLWQREHLLRDGLPAESAMYHVHSYCASEVPDPAVLAHSKHGSRFVTAVAVDSLWGVQFHPEKSSTDGLRLVANFVSACDRREVEE